MNEQLRIEINKCLPVLQAGGIFVYPTDTLWGIGCDATNETAVEKIFNLKKRNVSQSMIVLVSSEGMLQRFVKEVPAIAWDLIECAAHPLTIIYPQAARLAQGVSHADGTVGIRVTKDEFCSALITRLGKPIVSTSANLSGQPAPPSFSEIDPVILSSVDYVVNLRRQEESPGRPSSIIKVGTGGQIQILRK